MNEQWIQFRNGCRNRKDTHGGVDLCCTVDERHIIQAFHGDCVVENCSANWAKALNELSACQALLDAREGNESV
jgi:hypothetical protein